MIDSRDTCKRQMAAMSSQKKKKGDLESVIRAVQKMSSYGSEGKRLAQLFNLDCVNVTWDDCARNKGSVWGPCISDMTLQVNDKRMPVKRTPNFNDTCVFIDFIFC